MKANWPPRLIKRKSSGIVRVRITTPRGVQWISTGQTSYKAARAVCDAAMVEKLQLAACAEALTADVISRLTTGRRFAVPDLVDAWKEEVGPNLAPDTVAGYESTLRQWISECELERKTLHQMHRTTLSMWVNTKRVPVWTRKARLCALRSFYKFANAGGYCVGDRTGLIAVQKRDLYIPEMEKQPTTPITPEDFERLMASPKLLGFWRAAVPLAYWLGLRIRDCACLEWDSIRGDSFLLYPKKTGRRLMLSLAEPLLGGGRLQRTFLEMLERPRPDPRFCFPDERAVILHPTQRAKLSVYFQRVLTAHGIKGCSFHSLRHACAVRLRGAGKSLADIGQVLGHASEKMTALYADHPSTVLEAAHGLGEAGALRQG